MDLDLTGKTAVVTGASAGIGAAAVRQLTDRGARHIALAGRSGVKDDETAEAIRALENQVYTVTANRVGEEHREPHDALRFTGLSRIAGPDGRALADGPEQDPAILRTELDVSVSRCKTIPSGNDVFAERRQADYRGWSS